jgi:hypothetical protein
VNSAFRHLRPFLVSLVALILTAGIAFAAKPSSPAAGLATAAQHAGKTVPVVTTTETETETVETETETSESEDSGSGNVCADPRTLTAEQIAGMTHGAVVCGAAQLDTPDGFDNHGAWVKSWASDNAGSDASTKANSHAAAGLAHKK